MRHLRSIDFPRFFRQNEKQMDYQEIEDRLRLHRDDLEKMGVRHIGVFGSYVRDEATAESDVDVLVNFDPTKGLFVFIDLQQYLENLFDKPVDLVSRRALHPALTQQILDETKYAF